MNQMHIQNMFYNTIEFFRIPGMLFFKIIRDA